MERHLVFGLEGLDGTGKSTVGKILAEETASRYIYFADNNRLTFFRKCFDSAPTVARFLYYVGAAIENYRYVEEVRRTEDIFLDRTIFSTIAYHRALGLSEIWTNLIPAYLYNQFDGIIFFRASDAERKRRIETRNLSNNTSTRKSDDKSIMLADRIYEEYIKVLPQGTIFVETEFKTPRQVVGEIREHISLLNRGK